MLVAVQQQDIDRIMMFVSNVKLPIAMLVLLKKNSAQNAKQIKTFSNKHNVWIHVQINLEQMELGHVSHAQLRIANNAMLIKQSVRNACQDTLKKVIPHAPQLALTEKERITILILVKHAQ